MLSLAPAFDALKISLVTPAPPHSRNGNRNTAVRWAGFLRALGHKVTVEQEWCGNSAELLIALHARRSHPSIRKYHDAFPGRPLIVALTGTDLYRDIHDDASAQASLDMASCLVVLQSRGVDSLPRALRSKTRVIYQSALAIATQRPLASCFEVVVSGHLRDEKDPFRAAAALSMLPDESRIRVTHIGAALSRGMEAEARRWMKREPRYRWLGELPHWRALRVLSRARLMVISSQMEGGANVVGEALAAHVPVLASRIDGNLGMLGARHPGYFGYEDEQALARLLDRAERDAGFYLRLRRSSVSRAHLVTEARERKALQRLVSDSVRRPAPGKGAA